MDLFSISDVADISVPGGANDDPDGAVVSSVNEVGKLEIVVPDTESDSRVDVTFMD